MPGSPHAGSGMTGRVGRTSNSVGAVSVWRATIADMTHRAREGIKRL
jgi:hypothetical protein